MAVNSSPHECCSTRAGSGFTRKHLERLVTDKNSSLLQTLINYDRKKVYNIVPASLIRVLEAEVVLSLAGHDADGPVGELVGAPESGPTHNFRRKSKVSWALPATGLKSNG